MILASFILVGFIIWFFLQCASYSMSGSTIENGWAIVAMLILPTVLCVGCMSSL